MQPFGGQVAGSMVAMSFWPPVAQNNGCGEWMAKGDNPAMEDNVATRTQG